MKLCAATSATEIYCCALDKRRERAVPLLALAQTRLIFLPPYSPDMNPSVKSFSQQEILIVYLMEWKGTTSSREGKSLVVLRSLTLAEQEILLRHYAEALPKSRVGNDCFGSVITDLSD